MNTPLCRGSSRQGAFTRIELFALTLGLLLLAAVQFPLVGNTTVHSKAATCVENFHRLALALQMYATDSDGWLPPNPDDGNTIQGHNWISGNGGPGGGQEFDPEMASNPRYFVLANYLQRDPTVVRCPADPREGRATGISEAAQKRLIVPAARSVAMNAAVGTNPDRSGGRTPVDGPWLDNNHAHTYGRNWLTYGRESHFTLPGPSLTSVFIDEDELSINDGTLAFGMVTPEWIDFPATRHDSAGALSFADGHVEMHRWVHPRTRVFSSVSRIAVPGSGDYFWLRDRTSAAIPGR